MDKPNLIIYESQILGFKKLCKGRELTLAEEYMMAMFEYYETGEKYCGDNLAIELLMDQIYPLIDKQQQNYTNKVNKTISEEDFINLVNSGNFSTQRALAEYITEHYGKYSQQSVSRRLKDLGLKLKKDKSAAEDSIELFSSASVEEENDCIEEIVISTEIGAPKKSSSKFI